jgi:hypothetical protein
VFAVRDLLRGDLLFGALQTWGAVFYWRGAMRALAGQRPPALTRGFATFAASYLGLLLVFILLGAKGA